MFLSLFSDRLLVEVTRDQNASKIRLFGQARIAFLQAENKIKKIILLINKIQPIEGLTVFNYGEHLHFH